MNVLKAKAIDTWKICSGLCVICGMPLSLELAGRRGRENSSSGEPSSSSSYNEDAALLASFSDLKLNPDAPPEAEDSANYDTNNNEDLQENFVRVGLFKFHLLGSVENCHVIDKYTFLLQNVEDFQKELKKNETIIEALGGHLASDIQKTPQIYNKAADYCHRVAAKVVVPGCRACNAAMNRANFHADIVYRCFEPSSQLSFPELEDTISKTGKVRSKGVTTKKLIQQIAFYFRPPSGNKEGWNARDDSEIMLQAALWRCIANLCLWGKTGGVRFRLIATFYASIYIYEKLALKDLILFTDWHIHVFRVHYMQTYPHGSFFGMLVQSATMVFHPTAKNGVMWCEIVRNNYLNKAADDLDTFFNEKVDMKKVLEFKEILNQHIHNEKNLFCLLSRFYDLIFSFETSYLFITMTYSNVYVMICTLVCRKLGIAKGVAGIMSFFMYNFKDPQSSLLYNRGKMFSQEMKGQVKREMINESNRAVK